MGFEEREGVEPVGDRCEECGVKLTQQEIADALEHGGPALCVVHATEADAPGAGDELAGDEPV